MILIFLGQMLNDEKQILSELTATSPGRDSYDFDGIWLEQINPPPWTGFTLGLGAMFAIMFGTKITIITMAGIATSYARRLVCWLA